MAWFQVPLLSEHSLKKGLVRRLWRDWSPGFDGEEVLKIAEAHYAKMEVARGSLAWYRALLRPSPRAWSGWRCLRAPLRVPALAMTGERDGCMDSGLYDVLFDEQKYPHGLQVQRIAGVGHFLPLEAPERVGEGILRWERGLGEGKGAR